jgi:hypothetical protein
LSSATPTDRHRFVECLSPPGTVFSTNPTLQFFALVPLPVTRPWGPLTRENRIVRVRMIRLDPD